MKLNILLLVAFVGRSVTAFPQNSEKLDLKHMDSLVATHPKVFNINNIPINVCFIKDLDTYKGFIIAGHAEKAVCQIASLEIKKTLDSLGYTDSTVFTYGVGFDLRETDADGSYHKALQELHKKFASVRDSNLFEVRLFEVQLADYKIKQDQFRKAFTTIRNKFADSGLAAKPSKYILNYKNVNFPLVVPFFTADSIIRFRIPVNTLGELPAQNFQQAVVSDLKKSVVYYRQMINKNLNTISRIQASTNSHKDYTFTYYGYSGYGELNIFSDDLGGFPKPPDDYSITRKDLTTGKIISTRPITYEEAVRILHNPNGIHIDADISAELNYFIEKVRQFSLEFGKNKTGLIKRIKAANVKLKKEGDATAQLLNSLKVSESGHDDALTVDAFLRGWTINSNDSIANKKLYAWYQSKRPVVWKYILSFYPELATVRNPSLDMKTPLLAGIFQSENVFFHVLRRDNHYIVTPYQMLGGEFAELVDKRIPIPVFYTLNNFRTTYFY